MLFKNPELLYALFLLLIPVIVHLFKLRKFKQEDFTNVKFLKKVIQETRKSSRLKKWLILATRIFLLSSIILAFAQPYIPASDVAEEESQKLVYLDNSFSMQTIGENTNLLSASVNKLISQINAGAQFKVFTNDKTYFNQQGQQLIKELQEIQFSDASVNFKQLQLKAEKYFKNHPATRNEFILISDFQENLDFSEDFQANDISYGFVQLQPKELLNNSLDTAFISNRKLDDFELKIGVNTNTSKNEDIVVSVYDAEQLLARSTISTDEQLPNLSFTLPNKEIKNGKIELEDAGLQYDNSLYFSLNKEQAIKCVIISNTNTSYLKKIFTAPEFEISEYTPQQIDFNALNSANLIVIHEIQEIPVSLQSNLKNSLANGSVILVIPGNDIDLENYNRFFRQNALSPFQQKVGQEKLITLIEVDHPLFEGVFEERIENFEYPKTGFSYVLQQNVRPILSYEDNSAFLYENNSVFVFTTSLSTKNSNFQNSPLIVPVLYQIGRSALGKNQIYYESDKKNGAIDIPVSLRKDEVLHLVKNDLKVIPQQRNFANKVAINTGDFPIDAGNYQIVSKNNEIGTISFNYKRNETYLEYMDLSDKGVEVYTSISQYFDNTNAASQITALWKWFVIFALLFLAIEMLLLKFLK